MTSLWHLHSEVLGGFYASEIIVVAPDKSEARVEAMKAFTAFIKEQEKDFNTCFLVSSMPWEPEYTADLAKLIERFAIETGNIKQLESKHIIVHRV